MSLQRKVAQRAARRARRVRSAIPDGVLRVSVFKSIKYIYAQIIDDVQHKTLVSCSSHDVADAGDKTTRAHAVGKELARRALALGITDAAFDRGSHLYHGRVRALAEGLREGGFHV
jgi:large subunit ribosomal protein L18